MIAESMLGIANKIGVVLLVLNANANVGQGTQLQLRGNPTAISVSEPRTVREAFVAEFAGGESDLSARINERLKWKSTGQSGFDAFGPVQTQCPKRWLYKFGEGDGEKHVCGLLQETSDGLSQDPCVIIRIGAANQSDFERAVGKKLAHCQIHTLDCTAHGKVPPEPNHTLSPRVSPHLSSLKDEHDDKAGDICLVEKDSVGVSLSWSTFSRQIGLKAQPTVVYIDNEINGWEILQNIVKTRTTLPLSVSLKLDKHHRSAKEMAEWMNFMFRRGGYMVVNRHDKNGDKSEITLVQLASKQNAE